MKNSGPIDLLHEMDTRARNAVISEVRRIRILIQFDTRHGDVEFVAREPERWFPDELATIRYASRERMRVRHALKSFNGLTRALGAIRVV